MFQLWRCKFTKWPCIRKANFFAQPTDFHSYQIKSFLEKTTVFMNEKENGPVKISKNLI